MYLHLFRGIQYNLIKGVAIEKEESKMISAWFLVPAVLIGAIAGALFAAVIYASGGGDGK